MLQGGKKLAAVLESGKRPESFEEAYGEIELIAGLYGSEARAVWDFIKSSDIRSVVEIGRYFGTGVFMMSCAARKLERFLSIDIVSRPMIEDPMRVWAERNGFDLELVVCDSKKYEPDAELHWDFVFIDGGHTGETVTNDLEKFRRSTKFIGFHDFADNGSRNRHKRVYRDVVEAISAARDKYGWELAWPRGRSEVIFRTGVK